MITLTDAQACMLRLVARFGGEAEGWCEIELQYTCERTTPKLPTYLEASICKKVGDALRRKGLIDPEGYPILTEAGREWIAANPTRKP